MPKTAAKYILFALAALWGCRKDVDVFRPYQPSADELAALLAQKLADPAAQSHFALSNITDDQILTTPRGTRVFLIDTDYLFADADSGAPVPCSTCPNLKVEVTEVFSKAEMLGRGLSTVSTSGELFESGGMVRVWATCNGRPLALAPGRNIKVQIANDSPQDGFVVMGKTDGTDAWLPLPQQVYVAEWPKVGGGLQNGYEMIVRQMGWVANGRLLGAPQESTFCVSVPLGFGGQNTLAYLSFANRQVLAPLAFDLGANTFCYPSAPVGYPVQVVAFSKLGQQYWSGTAATETGSSGIAFPLETKASTEAAIINLLKGL